MRQCIVWKCVVSQRYCISHQSFFLLLSLSVYVFIKITLFSLLGKKSSIMIYTFVLTAHQHNNLFFFPTFFIIFFSSISFQLSFHQHFKNDLYSHAVLDHLSLLHSPVHSQIGIRVDSRDVVRIILDIKGSLVMSFYYFTFF